MGTRYTVQANLRVIAPAKGRWHEGDTMTARMLEAAGIDIARLLATGAIAPCDDKPAPKREARVETPKADEVTSDG